MAYHSDSKLMRDTREGKVGGVCAGISDYFKIDVTLIRIIAAISILVYGSGLLVYIILWALLPAKQD